jgi:hypothetical protein
MRILLPSLLLLGATVGCGRTSAGVIGNTAGHQGAHAPTAAAPAAAPPYAALFQHGKQLHYRLVETRSYYNPDDRRANKNGQVTDREEGDANVSSDSDDLLKEMQVAWVSDRRGIWRAAGDTALPASETEAAQIAQAAGKPFLDAEPKAVEEKKEEEEFGEYRTVAKKPDGAWCVEEGSWGGDSGGAEFCFTAGRGLTRSSSYFSGGMTREVSLELR